MGEQHLNLLCHARGVYANNECSSECGIHRGLFIAKQSQPHERLVSWRMVGNTEVGSRVGSFNCSTDGLPDSTQSREESLAKNPLVVRAIAEDPYAAHEVAIARIGTERGTLPFSKVGVWRSL